MNKSQSNCEIGVILLIKKSRFQEIKLLAKKGTADK